MKLDILLLDRRNVLAQRAVSETMKKHVPFIEEYTQSKTWQEKDLTSEKAWIQRVFYFLLELYGINTGWPQ